MLIQSFSLNRRITQDSKGCSNNHLALTEGLHKTARDALKSFASTDKDWIEEQGACTVRTRIHEQRCLGELRFQAPESMQDFQARRTHLPLMNLMRSTPDVTKGAEADLMKTLDEEHT